MCENCIHYSELYLKASLEIGKLRLHVQELENKVSEMKAAEEKDLEDLDALCVKLEAEILQPHVLEAIQRGE